MKLRNGAGGGGEDGVLYKVTGGMDGNDDDNCCCNFSTIVNRMRLYEIKILLIFRVLDCCGWMFSGTV